MERLIAFGEFLPGPIKVIAATVVSKAHAVCGTNYFKYEWDETEFKFGYWDRATLARASGTIENERFKREDIPLQLLSIPGSRDAMLDIGAFFGEYTVMLSKMNPDISLYSFEPNEYNYEVLKRNIGLNRVGENVTASKVCVGDTNKYTVLYERPTKGYLSATVAPENPDDPAYIKRSVKVVDIESFCYSNDIKRPWVKIDAEGVELDILKRLLESEHISSIMGLIELHLFKGGITMESFKNISEKHSLSTVLVNDESTTPNYLFAPQGQEYWKRACVL